MFLTGFGKTGIEHGPGPNPCDEMDFTKETLEAYSGWNC